MKYLINNFQPYFSNWWLRYLLWYCPQMSVTRMMTSSNGNIIRVTGPLWGELSVTGRFPFQRPVTQNFDAFFDLCLNKRVSKQSIRRWFEAPSGSLWRHCDGTSLTVSWHWFRYQFGAVRQQTITWASIDSVRFRCHMASQYHKELMTDSIFRVLVILNSEVAESGIFGFNNGRRPTIEEWWNWREIYFYFSLNTTCVRISKVSCQRALSAMRKHGG